MPRLKKSISAFDGSDVGISGLPVDRADRVLQPRVFAWIASILPVMVIIQFSKLFSILLSSWFLSLGLLSPQSRQPDIFSVGQEPPADRETMWEE